MREPQSPNVLISGGSVAGLALAYGLGRYGFRPTVVERAPRLRPGGQAIDVRGVAIDVAERMGIAEELRGAKTDMIGMSFVDDDGAELFRSTEATLSGGVLDNPDVEIMRDDLTGILHRAGRDRTEYLFGDSVTAITQHDAGVTVDFAHHPTREFDLVFGADGLHSAVRGLVFGDESRFIRHLGSYVSIFSTPNFLDLDRWQIWHQSPGRMSGIYTVHGNTEARAMLGFESPVLDYDRHDPDQQKKLVAEHFADDGWETARLLEAMWQAPDFYFDSTSQIHLDRWSAGRVALLGDAGYCGSLLTGQGTSLALVGAYVLAGELATAGDHPTGFAAYERELRTFVERNQHLALTNGDQGAAPDAVAAVATAITLPTYPA